jgi:hypothetical protein
MIVGDTGHDVSFALQKPYPLSRRLVAFMRHHHLCKEQSPLQFKGLCSLQPGTHSKHNPKKRRRAVTVDNQPHSRTMLDATSRVPEYYGWQYTSICSYQYIPVCLGRLADWSNPPPGTEYRWTSESSSSDHTISATCKCCSALAKLMIPMYLLCLRVQIGVENGCYWT